MFIDWETKYQSQINHWIILQQWFTLVRYKYFMTKRRSCWAIPDQGASSIDSSMVCLFLGKTEYCASKKGFFCLHDVCLSIWLSPSDCSLAFTNFIANLERYQLCPSVKFWQHSKVQCIPIFHFFPFVYLFGLIDKKRPIDRPTNGLRIQVCPLQS